MAILTGSNREPGPFLYFQLPREWHHSCKSWLKPCQFGLARSGEAPVGDGLSGLTIELIRCAAQWDKIIGLLPPNIEPGAELAQSLLMGWIRVEIAGLGRVSCKVVELFRRAWLQEDACLKRGQPAPSREARMASIEGLRPASADGVAGRS